MAIFFFCFESSYSSLSGDYRKTASSVCLPNTGDGAVDLLKVDRDVAELLGVAVGEPVHEVEADVDLVSAGVVDGEDPGLRGVAGVGNRVALSAVGAVPAGDGGDGGDAPTLGGVLAVRDGAEGRPGRVLGRDAVLAVRAGDVVEGLGAVVVDGVVLEGDGGAALDVSGRWGGRSDGGEDGGDGGDGELHFLDGYMCKWRILFESECVVC